MRNWKKHSAFDQHRERSRRRQDSGDSIGRHYHPPVNAFLSNHDMTTEADLNIAEIPYESGTIRFRYTRVMSPDRTRWIRHGSFVAYHENGTVASEGHYVDGKEDGLWRDFHPDGRRASEGHYRDGSEVGVWRFWSADGTEGPSESHGG